MNTRTGTPTAPPRTAPPRTEDRHAEPVAGPAQEFPPIRWPHPSAGSLACVALWAVGGIVAILVPYLIVPTGEATAPASQVWTAFSFTVLGAIIMIVAAGALARRLRDAGVLIVGCVPAISTIIGGVILATTKLT